LVALPIPPCPPQAQPQRDAGQHGTLSDDTRDHYERELGRLREENFTLRKNLNEQLAKNASSPPGISQPTAVPTAASDKEKEREQTKALEKIHSLEEKLKYLQKDKTLVDGHNERLLAAGVEY
jgi:hypothetical protein